MSVSVRIPTILRSYTGGAAEVGANAGTLREVIAGLNAEFPGIGSRLLDDTGRTAGRESEVTFGENRERHLRMLAQPG